MISNLHSFLYDYFSYNKCPIIDDSHTNLTVQLTRELDETLMNRPFYWHYMDKTAQVGQPMSLQLNIGTEKIENKESIHFGSPRLQQIFQHITDNARYTLLYEQTNTERNIALYPWLVSNIMVHYYGKQKKEKLYSFGLHLINGTIRLNVMNELEKVRLEQVMSDYSYTISPLIKTTSGFNRLFQFIMNQLQHENSDWVIDAKKVLNEELLLLEYFYQHNPDNHDLFKKEKERLTKRFKPRIELEIINAGLFYLSSSTSETLTQT